VAANGGTAVGCGASATGLHSVAFGAGAAAPYANSVAIGGGSVTSAPNTVSFGAPGYTRRLTNISPGVSGTDAVNVYQMSSAIAATAGMAIAATPSEPGKTTLNINTAFYGGVVGYGVGLAHKLDINSSVPVTVDGSFGASSGFSQKIGRVGLSIEF
jgi:autotransporter adhesin